MNEKLITLYTRLNLAKAAQSAYKNMIDKIPEVKMYNATTELVSDLEKEIEFFYEPSEVKQRILAAGYELIKNQKATESDVSFLIVYRDFVEAQVVNGFFIGHGATADEAWSRAIEYWKAKDREVLGNLVF